MFSEYASRFLTKPRAAPLFQGSTAALDSDTEAFLGWVDNSMSSSEEDPPDEIAVERPICAGAAAAASFAPTDPADSASEPPSAYLGGGRVSGHRRALRTPRVNSSLEALVATVYLFTTAATLTFATLITFSTSPSRTGVYPLFPKSAQTLVIIGIVAVAGAWGWLWAMRANPKEMVQLNTFAVPAVCVATALYGFLGSFHASSGHGLVHAVMRLGACIPLLAAVGWVYVLRRDKNNVGRASEVIAESLRVLNGSPMVVSVAVGCGIASTVLTYLWILFVSRAFLEGSLSILFALLFSFVYFWTWALLVNLERCLIALITSYWLENRVLDHWTLVSEVTHRFGACCLAGLLVVFAKAPAVLLGRRLGRLAQTGLVALSPASVVAILDPLTLTVAVSQRTSLHSAAQVVLSPEFRSVDRSTFWLAKMFLAATKITFSLVVGFIGWVHADRVESSAAVYSWLIAIAAFAVGWTVFGGAGDVLECVVDSLSVAPDRATERATERATDRRDGAR